MIKHLRANEQHDPSTMNTAGISGSWNIAVYSVTHNYDDYMIFAHSNSQSTSLREGHLQYLYKGSLDDS